MVSMIKYIAAEEYFNFVLINFLKYLKISGEVPLQDVNKTQTSSTSESSVLL